MDADPAGGGLRGPHTEAGRRTPEQGRAAGTTRHRWGCRHRPGARGGRRGGRALTGETSSDLFLRGPGATVLMGDRGRLGSDGSGGLQSTGRKRLPAPRPPPRTPCPTPLRWRGGVPKFTSRGKGSSWSCPLPGSGGPVAAAAGNQLHLGGGSQDPTPPRTPGPSVRPHTCRTGLGPRRPEAA